MEAKEWLQSEKDYQAGIDILREAKGRSLIWRLLSKNKTFYNTQRLEREIFELAKLGEEDESVCIRKHVVGPESNKEALKFTDSLLPAYQQQRRLYAQVNHLHPLLDATYNLDRKKAFEIKLALQNAWQEIEEIWRILNYWKENQVVLPNKYQEQGLEPLMDKTQMLKRRNNLRTYLSKHQGNPKKALACQDWQKELNQLDKQLADVV